MQFQELVCTGRRRAPRWELGGARPDAQGTTQGNCGLCQHVGEWAEAGEGSR